MKTLVALAACGLGLFAMGCGSQTTEQNAPPADSGAPAVTNDDAGSSTFARTLLTVPFLEGMPTDNRVGDPAIELDTASWFLEDRINGQPTVHAKKAAFGEGPAAQIALFFPQNENIDGVTFGVRFKIPVGVYDASLWVATPPGGNASGFMAGVLTLDVGGTGQPRYVGLAPDATSARDIAGVHWVQYTATVTPDLVAGWGYLFGSTDGATDYWIQAPLVRASQGGPHVAPAAYAPATDRLARFFAHARAAHPEPRLPANGFSTRVGNHALHAVR